MAYRITSFRPKRRSTRKYGKRRSSARPSRSTAKTRRYTRKRPMSKRSLIQKMAKKKRDQMLSAAAPGTNPDPTVAPTIGQPFIVGQATGNQSNQRVHVTVANMSHRWLQPSNYSYAARRTATRTYVTGVAETYRLVPNSSVQWWHRRIVFSTKDTLTSTLNAAIAAEPTSGDITRRVFRDMSGVATGVWQDLAVTLIGLLFKGTIGVDWQDPMKAPVDRTRVNIHSDRFTNISSGNDAPRAKIVKHYTRIGKTLQYNDEENGTAVDVSPFSVDSKIGVGNIFVADFFHCPAPSETTDSMEISSNSTYYWNER